MNLFDPDHLGTITRVTPTKDGWVSVYCDEKRVARIPRADSQALSVKEGDAWTVPLLARCTVAADAFRARSKALALIRVRPRSRAELLERLTTAGFSAAASASAVETLIAERFVDDTALADITAVRAASKGLSAQATIARLAARGLADATPPLPGSELDRALEAARNRAAKLPESLDASVRARRLLGALARLGYDEDTAREAVQRVLGFRDE